MKVRLRDVTVMLKSLNPTYTLTQHPRTKGYRFTCDGSGEFIPLEAKDVIAANAEMRTKLKDQHNGKLEPSLFGSKRRAIAT